MELKAAVRLKAASVPERFKTGVRNTSIPNPGAFGEACFNGKPEKYPSFTALQRKLFPELQKVLTELGTPLIYLGAARVEVSDYGTPKFAFRFVAVDNLKAPTFIWEHYEGGTTASGVNNVYTGGKKTQLNAFLSGVKAWEAFASKVSKSGVALAKEDAQNIPKFNIELSGDDGLLVIDPGPKLAKLLLSKGFELTDQTQHGLGMWYSIPL